MKKQSPELPVNKALTEFHKLEEREIYRLQVPCSPGFVAARNRRKTDITGFAGSR